MGRIATRYGDLAREDLDVLAFPVPAHLSRRLVNAAVVQRLNSRGLLPEQYAGDLPESQPTIESAAEIAEMVVVATVIAHGQAVAG